MRCLIKLSLVTFYALRKVFFCGFCPSQSGLSSFTLLSFHWHAVTLKGCEKKPVRRSYGFQRLRSEKQMQKVSGMFPVALKALGLILDFKLKDTCKGYVGFDQVLADSASAFSTIFCVRLWQAGDRIRKSEIIMKIQNFLQYCIFSHRCTLWVFHWPYRVIQLLSHPAKAH